jgi:hypothetical protein
MVMFFMLKAKGGVAEMDMTTVPSALAVPVSPAKPTQAESMAIAAIAIPRANRALRRLCRVNMVALM